MHGQEANTAGEETIFSLNKLGYTNTFCKSNNNSTRSPLKKLLGYCGNSPDEHNERKPIRVFELLNENICGNFEGMYGIKKMKRAILY